jgi:tetratricopeptide (TPR) repeat protein
MRFTLAFMLFCMLFTINSFAQKNLKIAEKAYKSGDYYSAVEFYELAFKEKSFGKKQPQAVEAYFKYAEACRNSYNFGKAETYYKKVVENSEEKKKYPTADFWYAYTLKHNAKYAPAKEEFEKFIAAQENKKDQEKLVRQARQEVKSCILALDIYNRPIEGVSVENIGENVNTQFSDFAPHLVDGDLYYSSLKFEAQANRRSGADDPTKKHLYGKLMVAKDGGKKKGALIGNLNQKYQNIGNSTLSPDGKRLYYTVCEKDPDYEFVCQIYVAERTGKGKPWSKGKEVSFNAKKGTNTHPNVSFDSSLNKEVIYYVSSGDGGQGDMDIWMVTYEGKDSYGVPVNLGNVINTEGKEATPFFHQNSQTLFFSSTWHPGLGGFDVFKSKRENGSWTEPINLGVPLNSAANDLYFYISPQADTFGYFASNRPGSKILTGESCCNDIYALVLPTEIEPGKPVDVLVSVDPEPTPQPTPDPLPTPEPEPVIEPSPEPEPEIVVVNTPTVIPSPEPEPVDLPTFNDLESMLPLTLYFHNDEPDSNTYAITTKTNYTQAYNSFMSYKELYVSQYSEQFKDNEKRMDAASKVTNFFDETVTGEYKRMDQFLLQMKSLLERGESLEVHIRGFCSPRATTKYNINLAKRRIACMKNQIADFEGAALSKYVRNGQIKFVELPIGEAQAPAGISDDIFDPKNSICSPEASAQRKVHIEAIKRVVN